MNELAYFMPWAGNIFLMMRFDCGARVTGHGHGTTKHGKRMPEGQFTECLRRAPPDKHRLAPPVSACGLPNKQCI